MKRFFSVLCTLLLCIPAFFAVMAETADDLFSDKDLTLAAPSSLWTLTPSSRSHTSPSVAGATRMLPSATWPLRR